VAAAAVVAAAVTTARALASIRLLQVVIPLLPSPSSSLLAILDPPARFVVHLLMCLLLLPSVLVPLGSSPLDGTILDYFSFCLHFFTDC
jgi:hypothetical protein